MTYEYNVKDIVGQTITIASSPLAPYTILYLTVTSYDNNNAYATIYMYLQHNYVGTGTLYSYNCYINGNNVQSYSNYQQLNYNQNNPINISYSGANVTIPLNAVTNIYQSASLYANGNKTFNSSVYLKLKFSNLKFNNTNINDVYFNGTKANHIYFNGTQIQ